MIDGEAVILGVDGRSDFNALHSDFSLAEQASAGVVYRPEVLLAEQFLATRNKSQFALKGLDPPLKARTWIGNQCRNLS